MIVVELFWGDGRLWGEGKRGSTKVGWTALWTSWIYIVVWMCGVRSGWVLVDQVVVRRFEFIGVVVLSMGGRLKRWSVGVVAEGLLWRGGEMASGHGVEIRNKLCRCLVLRQKISIQNMYIENKQYRIISITVRISRRPRLIASFICTHWPSGKLHWKSNKTRTHPIVRHYRMMGTRPRWRPRGTHSRPSWRRPCPCYLSPTSSSILWMGINATGVDLRTLCCYRKRWRYRCDCRRRWSWWSCRWWTIQEGCCRWFTKFRWYFRFCTRQGRGVVWLHFRKLEIHYDSYRDHTVTDIIESGSAFTRDTGDPEIMSVHHEMMDQNIHLWPSWSL